MPTPNINPPNAKTIESKTTKEKQDAVNKKPGKPNKKETEKSGKEQKPNSANEKLREKRKLKALKTVKSAMSKGIRRSKLKALLKVLKQKYVLKRADLNSKDDVTIENSPIVTLKGEALAASKNAKGEKDSLRKNPDGDIVFGKFTPSGQADLETIRQVAEDNQQKKYPL